MSTVPSAASTTPDVLAQRARTIWTSGDFGRIALSYQPSASDFVGRLRVAAGERVLDIASGTGNLALPAARSGAAVTGVDIAPALLEQARLLARKAGLTIAFDEGDCEALAYADGSFDTVMTMFGAMFAPHPERAASEMLRVVRPGGRIAMANWTQGGFIGEMFRTTGAIVPPPHGAAPSPLQWGDEAIIRQRLAGAASITVTRLNAIFEFPFSPSAVIEHFRAFYGPTLRAFDSLDSAGRAALRRALDELWERHNTATDGTTRVESEYLEVIAIAGAA